MRKTPGNGWVIFLKCFYCVACLQYHSLCLIPSTLVLVSSTRVFLETSMFRWASEQSLCAFQSPRIPLWTLSGFRLCAALPVSIQRSVGAEVWHRHRTWWEPGASIINCFLYYWNTHQVILLLFPLLSAPVHWLSPFIFLTVKQSGVFTFITGSSLSMKRLAHSLKPQSNEFFIWSC